MRERLIELRKIIGTSQRKFAEKCSMSQATYAPLETGRTPIREPYIKLICQTYDVNEEWLRYGEGEIFKKEPDQALEEILKVYDKLTPILKKFLLKQARELKILNSEIAKDQGTTKRPEKTTATKTEKKQ